MELKDTTSEESKIYMFLVKYNQKLKFTHPILDNVTFSYADFSNFISSNNLIKTILYI